MPQTIPLHIIGLGCARNDVDGEELAARFAQDGFTLTDDPSEAEVVVVNTCGFIEAAKKDSIDTILAASDLKQEGKARAVVAVGCLAERYGTELATNLPEADAVLGFDQYPDIAATVRRILDGGEAPVHIPSDRRKLLPVTPLDRPSAASAVSVPGHGGGVVFTPMVNPLGSGPGVPASGPSVLRHRLNDAPTAPLKIASGCDRRCAFCAIPALRGSLVSRPIADIVAEAAWLGECGVRELYLVSENTTAYGKDLAQPRALEALLRELSGVDGIEWIRLSYLQPAEMTPMLVEAMATTPKVVPYFDLPFQHASGTVLKRMRRFGDTESFLGLVDRIRQASPEAGIRTNVITGFPGETVGDVATLIDFLTAGRFDAIGVFGYSDEDGTAAFDLDGHVDEDEIRARTDAVAEVADLVMAERAEERVGTVVDVLFEEWDDEDGAVVWQGRAAHQGPESDGHVRVTLDPAQGDHTVTSGDISSVTISGHDGVDLEAVL